MTNRHKKRYSTSEHQGIADQNHNEQPRGIGWGGRWEWGSGQGDTCTPMADSCQLMAKTTTIL